MRSMRTGVCVALVSLALNAGGAAGCGPKQAQTTQKSTNQSGNSNAPTARTPARQGVEESVKGEIKVLASGNYSQVNDAFFAVARDAATYSAVRELAKDLPEMSADFFQRNAVVAAFLGQRRTGGYSVNITRAEDDRVLIRQQSPSKGSMVTQALTAPFKIVAVPIGDSSFNRQSTLTLEADGAWQAAARPYRVMTGEFTMSGGFAGRSEKYGLAGDLRIMRQGALATFIFNLKSSGGAKPRVLQETATGVVRKDNSVAIYYVDAGSLVDLPRSALKAKGSFTAGEDNLSLAFDSLPSNIADGYGGEGQLEASATAPLRQKNRPPSEM